MKFLVLTLFVFYPSVAWSNFGPVSSEDREAAAKAEEERLKEELESAINEVNTQQENKSSDKK